MLELDDARRASSPKPERTRLTGTHRQPHANALSPDQVDFAAPLRKNVADSAGLLGAQGLYEQQREQEAIDVEGPIARLQDLAFHAR